MKAILFLAFILLQSCSIEYRASRVPAMNDMLDRHYETIWNKENNLPGEYRKSKLELKQYYKSLKHEKVSAY